MLSNISHGLMGLVSIEVSLDQIPCVAYQAYDANMLEQLLYQLGP